ncbi:biogenesis of lysosome-related organelles complex 1 subunit 2-like [Dendronephthya gigantea]|uniref:biogenesis of lysosome-related organelles complex 1 subunit 2-like n=1 Tax=Dendronephthya gigantea TaxID=151771 RepID=UPI00106C99B9|nr:biogenesis of lysosome-related organelles complex 1 subunit 2-like [Dendronephthya gigantea]
MAETEIKHSEQEVNPGTSVKGEISSEIAADSGQAVNETASRSDEIKPATLEESCRNMFTNISEYLQCELNASLDDYELLEKLNQLTKEKYDEMDNTTKTLITRMKQINEKYEKLKPYLDMIDKVDASVTSLEAAAQKLDTYSKELEARFKKLEKAAT